MKILPKVCVLMVAALAVPAPAQVAAAISGKVEDASSAAVRQATVTVKSLETGATRVVTTDEAGNYRALSLGIGPHEVRASKTGFKTEDAEPHQSGGGAGRSGEPAAGGRRDRPGSDRLGRDSRGEYHDILGFGNGGRAGGQGPAAQRPQLRQSDHAQSRGDQLRPEERQHQHQQWKYVFRGGAAADGQPGSAERNRIQRGEPARDHAGRRQRRTCWASTRCANSMC